MMRTLGILAAFQNHRGEKGGGGGGSQEKRPKQGRLCMEKVGGWVCVRASNMQVGVCVSLYVYRARQVCCACVCVCCVGPVRYEATRARKVDQSYTKMSLLRNQKPMRVGENQPYSISESLPCRNCTQAACMDARTPRRCAHSS